MKWLRHVNLHFPSKRRRTGKHFISLIVHQPSLWDVECPLYKKEKVQYDKLSNYLTGISAGSIFLLIFDLKATSRLHSQSNKTPPANILGPSRSHVLLPLLAFPFVPGHDKGLERQLGRHE